MVFNVSFKFSSNLLQNNFWRHQVKVAYISSLYNLDYFHFIKKLMGLSSSVSQNIQFNAGTGQMLTNNNSEIIDYHYSVYSAIMKKQFPFGQ